MANVIGNSSTGHNDDVADSTTAEHHQCESRDELVATDSDNPYESEFENETPAGTASYKTTITPTAATSDITDTAHTINNTNANTADTANTAYTATPDSDYEDHEERNEDESCSSAANSITSSVPQAPTTVALPTTRTSSTLTKIGDNTTTRKGNTIVYFSAPSTARRTAPLSTTSSKKDNINHTQNMGACKSARYSRAPRRPAPSMKTSPTFKSSSSSSASSQNAHEWDFQGIHLLVYSPTFEQICMQCYFYLLLVLS